MSTRPTIRFVFVGSLREAPAAAQTGALPLGGRTIPDSAWPSKGPGVELRYKWNGDLRVSRVFKSWEDLKAAASEMRVELEARGCRSERKTNENG